MNDLLNKAREKITEEEVNTFRKILTECSNFPIDKLLKELDVNVAMLLDSQRRFEIKGLLEEMYLPDLSSNVSPIELSPEYQKELQHLEKLLMKFYIVAIDVSCERHMTEQSLFSWFLLLISSIRWIYFYYKNIINSTSNKPVIFYNSETQKFQICQVDTKSDDWISNIEQDILKSQKEKAEEKKNEPDSNNDKKEKAE